VFPTPEGFAPQQLSNIFIMMFDISKPQNQKEKKTSTFQLSHLVASLQAAFLHRLEKFGLRGRGQQTRGAKDGKAVVTDKMCQW